jgi:DNA-binding NtrC family response regulator
VLYDQEEPMGGLEKIFLSQGIRLWRSRTCCEARSALREPGSLSVVMMDVALPGADWTDVLRAASIAPARTPVIVVSRLLDIRLYLDVLDGRAHDFTVPPFSPSFNISW